MTRSSAKIPAIALLLATSAGSAFAAAPATSAALAKDVARYQRYFDKGQSAVASGAVAPYAKLRTIGVKGALGIGVGAAVGTMTVTERGMESRKLVGRVSGSAGIQLAAGPEFSSTRLRAKPGVSGDEILPRSHDQGDNSIAVFGARTAGGTVALEHGYTIAAATGFGLGSTLNFTKNLGTPEKSAMLQRLEEGKQTAATAREALARGDEAQARRGLERMKLLRSQIASEKKSLNKAIPGKALISKEQ